MRPADESSPNPPEPTKHSGHFFRRRHAVAGEARDSYRVLVWTCDSRDTSWLLRTASACETLRDGLHVTAVAGEALARLEARIDDLCLVLFEGDARLLGDFLARASEVEVRSPVVVLSRAEDAAAEREAERLGVSEWVVRARLPAQELERLVRRTVARAEEMTSLRASGQRFRAAFDASRVASVILDEEGRCLEVNAAARTHFGLEAARADALRSHLDPALAGAFDRLWEGRERHVWQETEVALRDARGEERACELSLLSRLSPDGHLLMLRDVTQREADRRGLALRERMAALATLATGVTHELNNPMHVVFATLEHLQASVSRGAAHDRGALDEIVSDLAGARTAIERVHRVLRDLSLFTFTDDEGAVGPLGVLGPLEMALRLTANTIRHRARLVKDLRRAPAVVGNAQKLTQVFVNLLLNAAEAIPEGSAAQHEVSVLLRRAEDGRVEVVVGDTGHGMTPEVLARAFEPFFTTRPVGRNTGLGLSVCHGIIAGMKGEILVESEPGRGTSVRVLLPVAGTPARPSTLTPLPVALGASQGNVMVVDDDALVCRSITRQLSGHHVVHAFTSPLEAVESILGGVRYDAILCDVMMPEMSGIEVYQKLAEAAPEQAARLVFVTGGAFSPDARSFLESGRHRVLEKPVSQAALLKAIERLMAADVRA